MVPMHTEKDVNGLATCEEGSFYDNRIIKEVLLPSKPLKTRIPGEGKDGVIEVIATVQDVARIQGMVIITNKTLNSTVTTHGCASKMVLKLSKALP